MTMATTMTTILSSVLMERLETHTIPKSKRKLQKHLRSCGQAYISRTGKLIPAKQVAGELCQCPHKCDASVPREARQRLFDHFYFYLGDADMQNCFLRQHMDLRARLNIPEPSNMSVTGRPPRRITCKYLVPILPTARTVEVCQKAFVSAFVITTKRVRLQREKLISSLGLNSYSSHNRGKNNNNNNNKATKDNNNKSNILNNIKFEDKKQISLLKHSLQAPFQPMELYQPVRIKTEDSVQAPFQPMELCQPVRIKTEDSLQAPFQPMELCQSVRIKTEDSRLQSPFQPMDELCHPVRIKTEDIPEVPLNDGPKNARDNNPLIPFGLLLPEGITIVPVATPDHARDIAIVNNFFSNQLWKPEYIGAYS